MNTILITGANGFVGHYLVEKFIRTGHRVIATGKGEQRFRSDNEHLQFFSLDITDEQAVHLIVEKAKPQVVVHCAAMTKPDECEVHQKAAWEVNVHGTENLLAAATEFGKPHFVHLSTDFIFAGTAKKYTEEDSADPVNHYGQTKWEAEKRVRTYAGPWSIVRPILIYGNPKAGRSNILTVVADALRKGNAVRLFTDQYRRPTLVTDLVWGIEQIIEQRARGIFHFSGKDTLSPFDIGIAVAEFLELDVSLVQPVTAKEFHQPAKRPPQTIFDLTKVSEMFGYQPTSFAEGLLETFHYTTK